MRILSEIYCEFSIPLQVAFPDIKTAFADHYSDPLGGVDPPD